MACRLNVAKRETWWCGECFQKHYKYKVTYFQRKKNVLLKRVLNKKERESRNFSHIFGADGKRKRDRERKSKS